MASSSPLLRPHDPRWEEINRQEREDHARDARAMTPAQRVELVQQLSDLGFEILNAARRSGHGTPRDPRA
jgi:hypothetical protein